MFADNIITLVITNDSTSMFMKESIIIGLELDYTISNTIVLLS